MCEIDWTPTPGELAYASATVAGMNFMYKVKPSPSHTLLESQRSVLVLVLEKVHRMCVRFAKVDTPRSRKECYEQAVGPTALGLKKPVVELTADSCDLLDPSGLVDPLPCIPPDVRAVILDSTRLFPNPPGGLKYFQGIKCSGRCEYI